jgi:hypothetical protein
MVTESNPIQVRICILLAAVTVLHINVVDIVFFLGRTRYLVQIQSALNLLCIISKFCKITTFVDCYRINNISYIIYKNVLSIFIQNFIFIAPMVH